MWHVCLFVCTLLDSLNTLQVRQTPEHLRVPAVSLDPVVSSCSQGARRRGTNSCSSWEEHGPAFVALRCQSVAGTTGRA